MSERLAYRFSPHRAEVIRDAVGIRPTRTQVRVEKEVLGKGLKVRKRSSTEFVRWV